MSTIAVDFDGCIVEFDGWKDKNHIGKLKTGAREVINQLAEEHKIIIYTCRSHLVPVIKFLREEQISYDYINRNPDQPKGVSKRKIMADHYIDDRAIEFNDNWSDILQILKESE